MKLKYYLRGLGVGILFSTIILSISFNAALKKKTKEMKSNADNTEAINSDEEIKDLEDLLVPTKEPTKESTKEPTKETKEPTGGLTEESAKDEEKIDSSNVEPSVTPTKALTEEEPDKEVVSKENSKDSQDYIIINIQKGMSSEEVALILKNYGIIENNKEFNNYLKDKGYCTNIKVGDFKISKNATYEQIADTIVIK